jgi:hypothetical protein
MKWRPVTINGILVQGSITLPNGGNACSWTDLAGVVAVVESGDIYFNVNIKENSAS